MVSLSFGSDPEFMIRDRNGSLVSAIGRLPGTKTKKVDLGNGAVAFPDNVLVECNPVPGNSRREVVGNFSDCFNRLARVIRNHGVLVPQASANYPAKELEHEDAKRFGCEAEYCGYELMQMTAPPGADTSTFRSGGGHIHLGAAKESYPLLAPVKGDDRTDRDWGRVRVIRMMDLFVGLPSIFIDHDPTSAARRKLYGKAGTHRPKEKYGVEYRSLGNFWLASPRLVELVYDLSAFVVDFVARKEDQKLWSDEFTCTGYDVDGLRAAINDGNKKAGAKFLNGIVKEKLPAELFQRVFMACEPVQYDFYPEWGIG